MKGNVLSFVAVRKSKLIALFAALTAVFVLLSFSTYAEIKTLGGATGVQVRDVDGKKQAVFTFNSEGTCEITPYAPDVIRVDWHFAGVYQKDEVAISKSLKDWPAVDATFTDLGNTYTIETSQIKVEIVKTPTFKVNFLDKTNNGFYISKDDRIEYDTSYQPSSDTSYAGIKNTNNAPNGFKLKNIRNMPSNEAYFGLGDFGGPQNRRGQTLQYWNSDTYLWGEYKSPKYTTFPFFYGVQGVTAEHPAFSYGIFFNNPARPTFKFGNQWADKYSYEAGDGQMDYYFFGGGSGHNMRDVLTRYSELTGMPQMLPKWAIGFHQSRYSYTNQSWVEWVVSEFRKDDIPVDAIYLDIDYMSKINNNWNQLTFNSNFPNPKSMVQYANSNGVKVVPLIESCLTNQDPKWGEANSNGYLIKRNDGYSATSNIFLGTCSWIDFTNSNAKNWWKNKLSNFMDGAPVNGIWNDVNEPGDDGGDGSTIPLNGLLSLDGRLGSNRYDSRIWFQNLRNTYANYGTTATFEALSEKYPNTRPFVLSRSAYPGIQKTAVNWSGDNQATYDHLRFDIRVGLGAMISGQVNYGSDVGGFVGNPDPEMMTRWIEWSSLSPYFRIHSQGGADREPFRFDPYYRDLMVKNIKQRYQLMPYLYTLMYNSTVTGTPMNMPVVMNYYNDTETHYRNEYDFLVGDSLLAAPVYERYKTTRSVYLPKDTVWYNWLTDQKYDGGSTVTVDAPLGTMPLFAKAGAIIPMGPSMKYTTEYKPTYADIHVWPAGVSAFTLYEDDGTTYNFKNGEYAKTKFESKKTTSAWEFTVNAKEGTYATGRNTFVLMGHAIDNPLDVSENNVKLTRYSTLADMYANAEGCFYDTAKKILYVKIANSGEAAAIKANYGEPSNWLGNSSISPQNGSIKSTSDVWLDIQSGPIGKVMTVSAYYSTDGGNTWTNTAMAGNGTGMDFDKWHVNLGKFADGTSIKYYFKGIDVTGKELVDNNNGGFYTANVSDKTNTVTVYYKSSVGRNYIHYGIGTVWTVAPGKLMADSTSHPGYKEYTIDLGTATSLIACFNLNATNWDNNNSKDYILSAGTWVINGDTHEVVQEIQTSPTPTITPTPTPIPSTVPASPTPTTPPTVAPSVLPGSVTVYYKSTAGRNNIHYGLGTIWTVAPGKLMADSTSHPGYKEYTIDLGANTSVQACFNLNGSNWDNNSTKNYSLTSGAWLINGDTHEVVADNGPVITPTPTATPVPSPVVSPTPTPTPVSKGVTIYYKSSVGRNNIHYGINNVWTAIPGKLMSDSTKHPGYKEYSLDLGSAASMQACFNLNGSNWDNNNTLNYTITSGSWYVDGDTHQVTSEGGVVPTPTPTATPTPTPVVTPTPTPAIKTITVYYKSSVGRNYMHYGLSGVWTQLPGQLMQDSVKYPGYKEYTVNLGTAASVQACFNLNGGNWDNNNTKNYIISAGAWIVDGDTHNVSQVSQ